jgi:hypothetical protein
MEEPINDPTIDRKWQFEQMDRLLGWELLQNALGRGKGEISERVLAERLAMPPAFWHVMILALKRRLNEERHGR